ncbi:hypothetical protein HKBW3S06_00810, partial [Candidatus Hakubella thermalkaliphila]
VDTSAYFALTDSHETTHQRSDFQHKLSRKLELMCLFILERSSST